MAGLFIWGCARHHLPVVSDLDIWRSANLLIKQHSDQADLEAAQRADAMLDKRDMGSRRVWLDILEKVKELQREGPAEGEPVH